MCGSIAFHNMPLRQPSKLLQQARSSKGRQITVPLAVAVLVILAGCSGAPTDSPSSPSTEVSDSKPVRPLADTGVNSTKTWNRTTQMVDSQVSRPSIKIIEVESTQGFRVPEYLRIFTNASTHRASAAGGAYITSNHTIVLFQQTVYESSSEELESILVHEYGHAIQSRDERFQRNGSGPTSEGWLVATTLREGMPTYLQKAYERRYLDLPADHRRTEYNNASTAKRYTLAPYFYGMQYYDRRTDSPEQLPEVIRTPPATTEQILYPNGSGSAPLSVTVSLNRSVTKTRTWGELGTRIMLRDKLKKELATRAAAGWSNDTYYQFESGDTETTGVVWVHRWDSAPEAKQFMTATTRYLKQQRANTETYQYRVKRTSSETTVLLAGNTTFLNSIKVSASSNESVTVTASHIQE